MPPPVEVVVIEEGADDEGQEAVEGQDAGAAAEGEGPAQAMDVEEVVEKEEVSGGGGEAGRSVDVDLSIDEDSDEEPLEPGLLTEAWNQLEARASQMKPGDPVCEIGRSQLRD